MNERNKKMLLCALSGILTGFTLVFKKLCFLNLFTLIPFIHSLKREGNSFLKGMIYSLFLNGVSMSFFYKMHPVEFLGFSGIESVAIISLMYFSVLLIEGVIGGLCTLVFVKFIKKMWLFPVFYFAYELATGFGELGLTFSHLYISWYKNTAFIQSASLLGGCFLTFLIAAINLLIYEGWQRKKLSIALLSVVVFSLNMSYGALKIHLYKNENFKYNLALIQGNISSLEKWQTHTQSDCFEIYKNLTREVNEKYDINGVIWPETVINIPINEESYWYKQIGELAESENIDIVTGAFFGTFEKFYNSIIAFDSNGIPYNDAYYKRHLIPVAENSYSKKGLKEGEKSEILNTNIGKIGGLICIDSAYPHLAREAKKKADYLVVATNDSWFEDSFGVENHFAHSVFRAVENKKFLLRAGNTGISAVISPIGEIYGMLNPMTKGYIIIKEGSVICEEK